MLVEIIDNQFRMSEEVLKFATDEEIKYIREICKKISSVELSMLKQK